MKNRPITTLEDIEKIVAKCEIITLSMRDELNQPYAVPMNFGYQKGIFYFHSAPIGKKISCLKSNPEVAITMSTDHKLRWQSEGVACSYSMKYRSVFASGKVEFVENKDTKIAALNIIMNQYTEKTFNYNDPAVRDVCVFQVKADKLEGREYGY